MSKRTACDKIDYFSVNFCNLLCGLSEKIFYPFNFFLKYFISPFERPYSFCFIINFFLLITPTLLLVILLIQFTEKFDKFYFIIGFLLCNLLINFVSTFYIYYLYGIHKVQKEKELTFSNIKLYRKYVFNYIINETFLKWVILYYFGQVVAIIMCFIWIYDPKVYSTFEGKIVLDFIRFAIYCNAIYLLTNFILFSLLFLFILCKIKISCLCKIIAFWFNNEPNESNNLPPSNLNDFLEKDNNFFVNKSLKFYKFIGLFDIEKAFPKREENVIKIENE